MSLSPASRHFSLVPPEVFVVTSVPAEATYLPGSVVVVFPLPDPNPPLFNISLSTRPPHFNDKRSILFPLTRPKPTSVLPPLQAWVTMFVTVMSTLFSTTHSAVTDTVTLVDSYFPHLRWFFQLYHALLSVISAVHGLQSNHVLGNIGPPVVTSAQALSINTAFPLLVDDARRFLGMLMAPLNPLGPAHALGSRFGNLYNAWHAAASTIALHIDVASSLYAVGQPNAWILWMFNSHRSSTHHTEMVSLFIIQTVQAASAPQVPGAPTTTTTMTVDTPNPFAASPLAAFRILVVETPPSLLSMLTSSSYPTDDITVRNQLITCLHTTFQQSARLPPELLAKWEELVKAEALARHSCFVCHTALLSETGAHRCPGPSTVAKWAALGRKALNTPGAEDWRLCNQMRCHSCQHLKSPMFCATCRPAPTRGRGRGRGMLDQNFYMGAQTPTNGTHYYHDTYYGGYPLAEPSGYAQQENNAPPPGGGRGRGVGRGRGTPYGSPYGSPGAPVGPPSGVPP
jgi:hypothetical protein